jgi:hypothetical protein
LNVEDDMRNIIKCRYFTFSYIFNFCWCCHPSSALKMEAVCSSETMISTYKSTRRHNPEEQHRHLHRRENLISYLGSVCLLVRLFVRFFLSFTNRHVSWRCRCLVASCPDSFGCFSTSPSPIVPNPASDLRREVCWSNCDISIKYGCLYILMAAEIEGCVFVTRDFANSVLN